jgi:molecular chaperone GrpE (heat shock protein)
MGTGDNYRAKAQEIRARLAQEHSQPIKAELEALVQAYLRLADNTERERVRGGDK